MSLNKVLRRREEQRELLLSNKFHVTTSLYQIPAETKVEFNNTESPSSAAPFLFNSNSNNNVNCSSEETQLTRNYRWIHYNNLTFRQFPHYIIWINLMEVRVRTKVPKAA
jgi:hypothetical protein